MRRKSKKRGATKPKVRLGLPDLDQSKAAVIGSLRSPESQRGYRHDGSVASLEEMFGASRLNSDHVPGGWKGPGVTQRAIPGHLFGLNLKPDDKDALLAYLRSL